MTRLLIVIVNYNSTDFLCNCLESVYRETRQTPFKVVVVDNASDSQDFGIIPDYRGLSIIRNSSNLGFSTACNQGLRSEKANYYLLLNPDCVIREAAIDQCVAFLESHSDTGILGCRVENPDGSLQLACRRKIPRPATAFYSFSGLGFLFPRSERFGAYNFGHLEDSEAHQVEAVSGSFLLLRREVLKTAGLLDESFFLYGEDLDLCYRSSLAGWKVYYYPVARVTHHKRASSSKNPAMSNFHFYDAMRIFYLKHFGAESNRLTRTLILWGINLLYAKSRLVNFLTRTASVGSKG